MARTFQSPNHIERCIRERRSAKIRHFKVNQFADTVPLGVLPGVSGLLGANRYAGDPVAVLFSHPDGTAADAAAGVQHMVAGLDAG